MKTRFLGNRCERLLAAEVMNEGYYDEDLCARRL